MIVHETFDQDIQGNVFLQAFNVVVKGGHQQTRADPPLTEPHLSREAEIYWREALYGTKIAVDFEFESCSLPKRFRYAQAALLGEANADIFNHTAYLPALSTLLPVLLLSATRDDARSYLARLGGDTVSLAPEHISNAIACCPILCPMVVDMCVSAMVNQGGGEGSGSSSGSNGSSGSSGLGSSSSSSSSSGSSSGHDARNADGGTATSSRRETSRRWCALQILLAIASKSTALARAVRSILTSKKVLASVCIEITAKHVGAWDVAEWLDRDIMPAARMHECWFFKGLPEGAYRCISDCALQTMAEALRGIVHTDACGKETDLDREDHLLRLGTNMGSSSIDVLRINARWLVAVLCLSSQARLSVSLGGALPILESMMEPSSGQAAEASRIDLRGETFLDVNGGLWVLRLRIVLAVLLSRLLVASSASTASAISAGSASISSCAGAEPLPYVKPSAPVHAEDEGAVSALVSKCVKLLGGAHSSSGSAAQAAAQRTSGSGSVTAVPSEIGELWIDTSQSSLQLYCMYLSLCCVCSSRVGVRDLCIVELGLGHMDVFGDRERDTVAGGGGAVIRSLEQCVRTERNAEKIIATFSSMPLPACLTAGREQAGDWLQVMRLLLQFDIFRAAKESRDKGVHEEREGWERAGSRGNSLTHEEVAVRVPNASSMAPGLALPSIYSVLNDTMQHVLKVCAWPPPACLQRVIDLWVSKCTEKRTYPVLTQGSGNSSGSSSSSTSHSHSSGMGRTDSANGASLASAAADPQPLLPPMPAQVEQSMRCLVLYSPDSGRHEVCFCGCPAARLHVTGMAEEWARAEAAAAAAAAPASSLGASSRAAPKRHTTARLALVGPFRLYCEEGMYVCPCYRGRGGGTGGSSSGSSSNRSGESCCSSSGGAEVHALFAGVVTCYASMRYALGAADTQGLCPAPFAANYRELPVKRALELLLVLKADPASFALLDRMLELCARLVPEALPGVCRDALGARPVSLPGGHNGVPGDTAGRAACMRQLVTSEHILRVAPPTGRAAHGSVSAGRAAGIALPSLPAAELRALFVEIMGPFLVTAYWANEDRKTGQNSSSSGRGSGISGICSGGAMEVDDVQSATTTSMWCAWLHLHASASAPQALELFAVNWLFSLQSDQGSRLGCSQRIHFTSYAALAQEPTALLRLPSSVLHIPLVLKIVGHVMRGLLLASRAGAVLALRAKKALAVAAWAAAGKGSSSAGAPPTAASVMHPINTAPAGRLGKSAHDLCLFIDEGVFLDLQTVILARMLMEVWLDYQRQRQEEGEGAGDGDGEGEDVAGEAASLRASVLDLLEVLVGGDVEGSSLGVEVGGGTAPSQPLISSLLHFGVSDGAARLLCLRPNLSEALGRGIYSAVYGVNARCSGSICTSGGSADPAVMLTSSGLASILQHCLLFLQHHHPGRVSASLAKRLATALPRFLFATIHCLTRFHPQSAITALTTVTRALFLLLRSRHPVAAMRMVDFAVMSEVQRAERVKEARDISIAGGRLEQEAVGVQRLRASVLELVRDTDFQGWGKPKDGKEAQERKRGRAGDCGGSADRVVRTPRSLLASELLRRSDLTEDDSSPEAESDHKRIKV